MNEKDIREIILENDCYGQNIDVPNRDVYAVIIIEDFIKAIMDKIREEEKNKANLPDSFEAYMELPWAEKIKLFKKG